MALYDMNFKLDEAKKEAFFEELSKTNSVTKAAKRADIARGHAYWCRNKDPEFAEAWDAAVATYHERILAIADRRGVAGWEELLFTSQGQPIEEVRSVKVGTDIDGEPVYEMVKTGRQARKFKFSEAQLARAAARAERYLDDKPVEDDSIKVQLIMPDDGRQTDEENE